MSQTLPFDVEPRQRRLRLHGGLPALRRSLAGGMRILQPGGLICAAADSGRLHISFSGWCRLGLCS